MSIMIRRANERGGGNHGWLNTRHTFSFADYHDPRWMNYRRLRVLNEDVVAAGQGFGMHPHRDMEIVTIVRSGALAHRDSLGTEATIRPGEVQRMTAGRGIRHSEINPSPTEPVHLFQLWVMPERDGLEPGYEQKAFATEGRLNRPQLVVSPDGAEGSLRWFTDARLYLLDLEPGRSLSMEWRPHRHAWVQVMQGQVTLAGEELATGDGAGLVPEGSLNLESRDGASLLLFELV